MLTIDHVTLQEARLNSAGAVSIYNQGTLTLSNSTVSNMFGGGIYNAGGAVTVSNSTLVGNAADTGGGIANTAGR